MSDTPRTDANVVKVYRGAEVTKYVAADFARQLERELAAARQEATEQPTSGLLMTLLAYRDLWLICHEHNPREPKPGENMNLGHLRGKLFASIDAAVSHGQGT